MKSTDENALLMCPVPTRLLAELDALAKEGDGDRGALVVALLGEALRVRALGKAVEGIQGAAVIQFPRPSWAVEPEGPEGAGDA